MVLITDSEINDNGSAKFTFSPINKATGGAIVPLSAVWKLTDLYGAVINGRSAVTIESPTSSLEVLLTGDDLAIQDSTNDFEKRLVTMVCTYDAGDSVTADLVQSAKFTVFNEPGVS